MLTFACPAPFNLKPFIFQFPRRHEGKRGRRLAAPEEAPHGRYRRPRLPSRAFPDLALDATLRAAAARGNGNGPGPLKITWDDLRYKLRTGKNQALLLLVVDASGSMGAQRRMAAAKQTALSFLVQAYQRRDRVAMITFNGARARVILSPTRSTALARKKLADVPTGGKTPLAHALTLARRLARQELLRQQSLIPITIVISDGSPNIPLTTRDPCADALGAARALGKMGLPALFVDTDQNYFEPGMGRALARALRATYKRFEELS